MSKSKVRRTLTLDPEVIDALGDDDAALSATVNEILAPPSSQCASRRGGVVLTADVEDISALAGTSLHISVRSIAKS